MLLIFTSECIKEKRNTLFTDTDSRILNGVCDKHLVWFGLIAMYRKRYASFFGILNRIVQKVYKYLLDPDIIGYEAGRKGRINID